MTADSFDGKNIFYPDEYDMDAQINNSVMCDLIETRDVYNNIEKSETQHRGWHWKLLFCVLRIVTIGSFCRPPLFAGTPDVSAERRSTYPTFTNIRFRIPDHRR